MEKANIYVAKHKMVDMIDCNTFNSNIGEIVLTVHQCGFEAFSEKKWLI